MGPRERCWWRPPCNQAPGQVRAHELFRAGREHAGPPYARADLAMDEWEAIWTSVDAQWLPLP
eukprot:8432696-Pyramimonas_sp.AAC.1